VSSYQVPFGNWPSVCMYVCVYVCMYVCMYVLCVCTYVCMYVCIYVCFYVYMYVCVYVYVCMCVCMYGCMCVCMYVCMYVSVTHTFIINVQLSQYSAFYWMNAEVSCICCVYTQNRSCRKHFLSVKNSSPFMQPVRLISPH